MLPFQKEKTWCPRTRLISEESRGMKHPRTLDYWSKFSMYKEDDGITAAYLEP